MSDLFILLLSDTRGNSVEIQKYLQNIQFNVVKSIHNSDFVLEILLRNSNCSIISLPCFLFYSSMPTALTLGCDSREHALFVNLKWGLDGTRVDPVNSMLLIWFKDLGFSDDDNICGC